MAPFPRMHVSLYVSDIQKSIAFYNLFFGHTPVKVKPDYAKYILEQPSLIISFVQAPDKVSAHFGHLGFQVETLDDLHRILHYARQVNIVSFEEIGTNCCYATQDKFWVNDPDGFQWEVYYFHADAEFNDPHYDLSEKTNTANDPIRHPTRQTIVQKPCC